jgi:hypothetical protein
MTDNFLTRVSGLPVIHFEYESISISLIGVKKKLQQEMNQQYKTVDPLFAASKRLNVIKLRKIRKDLISVEKYFTLRD